MSDDPSEKFEYQWLARVAAKVFVDPLDFYGHDRNYRQVIGVLSGAVALVAFTVPTQIVLAGLATFIWHPVMWALVLLASFGWIVLVGIGIFGDTHADRTWLEGLGLLIRAMFLTPLAFLFLYGIVVVIFGGLGYLASFAWEKPVAWVIPAVLSTYIGGMLIYAVVIPNTVRAVYAYLVKKRADQRWQIDTEHLRPIGDSGGTKPEPAGPVGPGGPPPLPRSFLEDVGMTQKRTAAPVYQAVEIDRQAPMLQLTGLPPGVVDIVRRFEATARSSRAAMDIFSQLRSRLEAAAAKRNMEEITDLFHTFRAQVNAACQLRRSLGRAQRLEVEEYMEGLRLEKQVLQLESELAKIRPETPADWSKREEDLAMQRASQQRAQLAAMADQLEYAKKVQAIRKQAEAEIADESFRKMTLAKIDGLYQGDQDSEDDREASAAQKND